MRIFVDTNLIMEMLEQRSQADTVSAIFDYIESKDWEKAISVGSFYTITYLTERILHKQGLVKPKLIVQQRKILNGILDSFLISAIGEEELAAGVNDEVFSDLEDSYQLQSAQSLDCDTIVTINIADFPVENEYGIEIMTPQEFYSKYCIETDKQ